MISCLTKCGMALIVAALAELRFFFVLFIAIVSIVLMITRTSVKKIWIIIATGMGVYAGTMLLMIVFPEFSGFFSIERMLRSASKSSGYSGQNTMNRLTAIPMIWSRFLKTWPEKLFGLGLGNCDTSSFSFLNTAFYEQYGYLHYNWFSSAFMFLETGVFGLALYVLFFVSMYFFVKKRKRNGKGIEEYCQLACVLVPVCLVMIIYNGSMRLEEAYIMYFVLALPFINKEQSRMKGGVSSAEAIGEEAALRS